MVIVNTKRRKQIDEFIDKDHKVMDIFYEITDTDIPPKKLLKEMQKLIKVDKDFYDPYLVIADILFSEGKKEEGRAILKEAYERVVMRIADS